MCLVMYGVSVAHWVLILPWHPTNPEGDLFFGDPCIPTALLLVNVSIGIQLYDATNKHFARLLIAIL